MTSLRMDRGEDCEQLVASDRKSLRADAKRSPPEIEEEKRPLVLAKEAICAASDSKTMSENHATLKQTSAGNHTASVSTREQANGKIGIGGRGMMFRIGALIGATLMATTAFAREDVEIGSWLIFEKENACYAMASFTEYQTKKESTLAVSYNAKTKLASILFSNTKATSVVDGQKLKLEILFLRQGKGADDGWGTKTFTAQLMDGVPYFWSEALEKILLDDFARYATVAFFVDETLVSSFDLKGSAPAVAELRKCAFEIAGLNPLDPFLN